MQELVRVDMSPAVKTVIQRERIQRDRIQRDRIHHKHCTLAGSNVGISDECENNKYKCSILTIIL